VINNTDQKYFPVKGWNVRAEGGYVYSQNPDFEYSYSDSTVNSDTLDFNYDNYFKIYLNASHYCELNSKFSWSQNITLAYLIIDSPYIANNFVVGGVDEIIRNQVVFVGLNESEVKTGSIASAQLVRPQAQPPCPASGTRSHGCCSCKRGRCRR